MAFNFVGFNKQALAEVSPPVIVFAAASLKSALDPLTQSYLQKTGQEILVSYGSSAAMARQILAGAPAHIYLSAAPNWMDFLSQEGLLAEETRQNLLRNELLLLAYDKDEKPLDLTNPTLVLARLAGKTIATGHRKAVPLGAYGAQALGYLHLWETLASQLVPMENASAAFNMVELGQTDFAIAYNSDALSAQHAHIIAKFPPESHDTIIYPMALVKTATNKIASAFFTFLNSPDAQVVFTNQGFQVLD
ncbi:MAG: molybdate ABC transporter substrate-binding protein [Paracoccaceae bacterium]